MERKEKQIAGNGKQAAGKEKREEPGFKSSTEVEVPKRLIDQVIGQENSVEIVRKAAAQRRNVLLIGIPGTGKSMLAQAMAEVMPVSELNDILIYPNRADPNNPKVRIVKGGEGRKIVHKLRLDARSQEDNMRLISFMFPLAFFIMSSVIWQMHWISDVIYAATLLLGGFLVVGFAVSTQMKQKVGQHTPKLLIDNSGKKTAPFIEATGARAGSLLGDVRHDPLQCHLGFNNLYVQKGKSLVEKPFAELWSEMFEKYGNEVIRNKKGHEAIMLPAKEKIYTLGRKNGEVVLSRILSLNRQPFEGKLVELKAKGKKIALTPEHKVITSKADKRADKISEKDKLITLIGPGTAKA